MIELLWNGPISEEKMMRCIEAVGLQPGQRVLDVGCGCGEVLIRTHERFQIQGTGIDSSAEHIAEANRRATGRVVDFAVRFVEADAAAFHIEPESLDLAICMGSTHAFDLENDAYPNAIQRLIPMVTPGGRMLIADGYMKQPAAPGYRELLGDSLPDDMTHAANVATGKDLGLIPLAAWTSNDDEWDDFEWTYQRIVERNAEESPEDQKRQSKLAGRREWMDAYLQWGRATLGFGIYLFQRPRQ